MRGKASGVLPSLRVFTTQLAALAAAPERCPALGGDTKEGHGPLRRARGCGAADPCVQPGSRLPGRKAGMAGRETRSPGLLNVLEEQTRNRRKTRRAPRAGARPARRRGGKRREPRERPSQPRAGSPHTGPGTNRDPSHPPQGQGAPRTQPRHAGKPLTHTHGEGAPRTGNPLTHTGNPFGSPLCVQGAPHTHTQTQGAPHASTHTQGAPPPPPAHSHTFIQGPPPHIHAQHPHKHTQTRTFTQGAPHTQTQGPPHGLPKHTEAAAALAPSPAALIRGPPHRGVPHSTPGACTVLTFPICWPQTKCGENEQEPPDDGEGPSSSARLHSSFFNWTKSPFPKTKQSKKKSKIVRFLSSPRPLKITSGGGAAGQGK